MTPVRVALALSLAARVAAADPPVGTLPASPWPSVEAFPLRGAGVTAPVVLPGARVAVFTRAPPSLVLVDVASGNVRASDLEEPPAEHPDGPVVARCDARGRLVYQGAGGTLFRLGLDGRVRAAPALPGIIRGLVELPGGAEVATVERNDQVDFVSLRPDGSVAAVRSVNTSGASPPVLLADGRVAVAITNGVAAYSPSGVVRVIPGVSEARRLVRLGEALMVSTQTETSLLDDDGLPGPPRPLPGRVRSWFAGHDGGALAWVPPMLVAFDRRGAAVARFNVPVATASVLVDATGAVLLATTAGRIVALESDGRQRWVVDLQRSILPWVTLGPDGDGWVTATNGNLLRLSSRPASSQEAPRANR